MIRLYKYEGFTLIEVAIVVALTMIIATMVMIHGTYINRALVYAEIQKIALICRYLQHSAITFNQEKTLFFDIKNNSYHYENTHEQLCRTVSFGTIEGAKGPPSYPDALIKKPITFGHNKITFYPDGIIQAGTVYLVSDDKHVMYALSNSVSQVSYLRIYKYDGAWHCLT